MILIVQGSHHTTTRPLASTGKLLFMHTRLELLSRRHGIQCVDSDVNTRTGEILSSVNKPLEHGDDDNNGKCCNAVI